MNYDTQLIQAVLKKEVDQLKKGSQALEEELKHFREASAHQQKEREKRRQDLQKQVRLFCVRNSGFSSCSYCYIKKYTLSRVYYRDHLIQCIAV